MNILKGSQNGEPGEPLFPCEVNHLPHTGNGVHWVCHVEMQKGKLVLGDKSCGKDLVFSRVLIVGRTSEYLSKLGTTKKTADFLVGFHPNHLEGAEAPECPACRVAIVVSPSLLPPSPQPKRPGIWPEKSPFQPVWAQSLKLGVSSKLTRGTHKHPSRRGSPEVPGPRNLPTSHPAFHSYPVRAVCNGKPT